MPHAASMYSSRLWVLTLLEGGGGNTLKNRNLKTITPIQEQIQKKKKIKKTCKLIVFKIDPYIV